MVSIGTVANIQIAAFWRQKTLKLRGEFPREQRNKRGDYETVQNMLCEIHHRVITELAIPK